MLQHTSYMHECELEAEGEDDALVCCDTYLASHHSVVMTMPLHFTNKLRHVCTSFDTGTCTAASVLTQLMTAEMVNTWQGNVVVANTTDGASPNIKAYRGLATVPQFYSDPARRDNADRDVLVAFASLCYAGNSLVFFLFDPPHVLKNQRNNLWYSQEGGTKKLLLQGTAQSPGSHKLVHVDWVRDQVAVYQESVRGGRLRPQVGLNSSMFESCETPSGKMKVQPALDIMSEPFQQLEDRFVEQHTPAGDGNANDRRTIESLQALRPWKKAALNMFTIMNGQDVQVRAKGLPRKSKLLSADCAYEMKALREYGRLAQAGAQAVSQAQALHPALHLTHQRHFIAHATQAMIEDVAFGVPSLTEYYSTVLRPGMSLNPRALTNDNLERHFGISKDKCHGDHSALNLALADTKAVLYKIATTQHYAEVHLSRSLDAFLRSRSGGGGSSSSTASAATSSCEASSARKHKRTRRSYDAVVVGSNVRLRSDSCVESDDDYDEEDEYAGLAEQDEEGEPDEDREEKERDEEEEDASAAARGLASSELDQSTARKVYVRRRNRVRSRLHVSAQLSGSLDSGVYTYDY